jgi:AMP-binding enzyme C-terminal domain/Phosphopantetheine attachment site/AMP-binding enzyme
VWSAVQRSRPDIGGAEIGGPLANTSLRALDANLQPVPIGVAGELYIGGAGVGRGYWGQPALTASRFVADPFGAEPGARMYATGDVVRPLADGRFEFLGRADHQVKVRGFRIETGEVESAFATHPAVATAAVVTTADGTGDAALVAFVVPEDRDGCDEAGLRAHLRRTLPDYMVPSKIVELDRLPLTLNGKVDRRALTERAAATDPAKVAYVAPRNEVEDSLQGIWKELLGRDRVGVHENFFEIGGHSLLAAKMHARIVTADLGDVELVDLFTHPTIARLAGHLGGGGEDTHGALVSRVGRQRAAVREQRRRRQHR